MAFDLTTAKPKKQGFDLSTAKPVGAPAPVPETNLTEGGAFTQDASGQNFYNPDPATLLDTRPVVQKAARDIGVGALRLAPDIASFLLNQFDATAPAGEYLQRGSEEIGKMIPQVRTGGPVGDIASTLLQYGVPGVAGFKYANGVLPTLQGIPKYLKNLTGAAAADVAVTDPSQAMSVGDFTGGPTDIQPGDQPLTSRAKVGAETYVAGPVIDAVATPIRAVAGMVADIFRGVSKPYTEEGAKDAAAKTLQHAVTSTGNTPEAAVRSIEQTQAATVADPAFKPTAGSASNDPGLLALQNTFSTDPRLGARNRGNEAAMAQNVDSLTRLDRPSPEGDVAARYLEGERTKRLAAAEAPVAAAEAGVTGAQAGVAQAGGDLTAAAGKGTKASENLDELFRGENQRMTAEKNAKYDLGEAGKAEVDPTAVRSAADRIAAELGPLADPSTVPGKVLARVQALGKAAEGGEPVAVTLNDLQKLRIWVSQGADEAFKGGNAALGNAFDQIKTAISTEYSKAGARNPELGARLKEADDFFRDEFAPRFRQGQGGKLAKDVRRGAPGAVPTKTAGRFLGGNKEAAQDIKRIIEGSQSAGDGKKAVVDYLASDLADSIGSSKPTVQKIDKWIADRREVLNQFPEAAQEIFKLRNRFGKASENLTQAESTFAKASEGAKAATKAEQETAAARFYLGKDPIEAIRGLMASTDPATGIKKLMAEVAKDTTGEASAGLKRAVSRWVADTLKSPSSAAGGAEAVNYTKAIEALRRPKLRDALKAVYGPDVKYLEQARTQIELMMRNEFRGKANTSDIKALESLADRGRIVLASIYGIVKGRGVFAISKFIAERFGKDPVAMAEKVLLDGLLDPELAKTLLMRDTAANQKVIQRRLGAYIANNYPDAVSDDKSDALEPEQN